MPSSEEFDLDRQRMVDTQLIPRRITDEGVLASMRSTPRHLFVPPHVQMHAYEDHPLPIGEGQTISQPYIVALMIQIAQVKSSDTVLEIGTGSGYAAAVLAGIVKQVHTIERLAPLAEQAQTVFNTLHLNNIIAHTGDGTLGLAEKAPYNAIIVTAGAPVVPDSLKHQLAIGGRLIIPVGDALSQQLLRITRTGEENFASEIIEHVRFVPLIGQEGWTV